MGYLMTKKKAIIILSGGQDSCTTLAIANDSPDVEIVGSLHFQYGQKHAIERKCALDWSNKFVGRPMEVIDVPSLSALGNSALTDSSINIMQSHPTLHDLPASFVPGRNLIFITLAAAYAMRVGATQVWTGVCQTDYSGLAA